MAEVKSWWQTVAGVTTGVAALITAIAGLIVALHQVGLIGSRSESVAAVDRSETARMPATPDTGSRPLTRGTSPAAAQPGGAVHDVDRKPRSIALPAKREYVLGNDWARGRYTLVSANVIPRAPESDILAIKMRVIAEGQPGYSSDFSSGQFRLVVNEEPIKPDQFFSEQVRYGESMEREIRFRVAPALSQAELRIHVGVDWHAAVPIQLLPSENQRHQSLAVDSRGATSDEQSLKGSAGDPVRDR